MSRQLLYVAAPLRPTEDEIRYAEVCAGRLPDWGVTLQSVAINQNLQRAMRWLAWLRRSFPETTFIAPWIASVLSLDGDDSPTLREAGLVDDCAVVERCDGIVLVGGRISDGMRREMEHGQRRGALDQVSVEHGIAAVTEFKVYSLADLREPPLGGPPERADGSRPTFEDYARAHEDS